MKWLKITYDEGNILRMPGESNAITVSFVDQKIAPVESDEKSFRFSPVFPLIIENKPFSIDTYDINFYNFPNAYAMLGRIDKLGSERLRSNVFFCIGLSSIILIVNEKDIEIEFEKVTEGLYSANERWEVKASIISKISYDIKLSQTIHLADYKLNDYSSLPVTERSLIDEFSASIQMMLVKLVNHMP